MSRSGSTLHWAVVVTAALTGAAAAHTGERGFVLLLPTEYYLTGGALAVAASFLLLTLVPGERLRAAFAARLVWRRRRLGLETATCSATFLGFAALVVAGLQGSRDPLVNPLPLTIWTLWWVGFTLATAVLGDLWRFVNPWTGPYRLMRRIAGARDAPPLRLPARVGYGPAILGFLAFAWFEQVDIAPADPARLAYAAAAYWAIQFLAMLAFGEAVWSARGECFSVFFGFVARLAPVHSHRAGDQVETIAAVPGARLTTAAPPVSAAVFILLVLATVSFDGLRETYWWLAGIGVNPLEFPGRSAVIGVNTVGLLAAWGALTAVFWLCVRAGLALVGAHGQLEASFSRLALSLIPIALGYHFAHYLPVLLVNGQYALAAASDPLGTGADLFGLGDFHVTTSFFYDFEAVRLLWRVQAAAIVVCHIVAVLVAHVIALDIHGPGRAATLSQIPLAMLMVLYTLLGLWLLAQPTGA